MERIRYTRVRNVRRPERGHFGDAGLDFYLPQDLTKEDLENLPGNYDLKYILDSDDRYLVAVTLAPHTRALIPSGVKVLLEPQESMLQVNNKSGVSTKSGLIFTAQVIDSPYTGEIHFGVVNTSEDYIQIQFDKKLVQLIHIPIFLTEPEEIPVTEYEGIAEFWGSRGSDGFGSTDNK